MNRKLTIILLIPLTFAAILFLTALSKEEVSLATELKEQVALLHVEKYLNVRYIELDVENVARFVKQREEEFRLEQERLEQERLEEKRMEEERLEQEKLAKQHREEQRKLEAERKAELDKQQKQAQQSNVEKTNQSANQEESQPANQPVKQPENAEQEKKQEEKKEEKTSPPVEEIQDPAKVYPGISNFDREVVKYTNIERANHGLSELKIDNRVSEVAWYKSKDMEIHSYFSHTSPTYGSPFDMMRHYGISFRGAAENIARGYGTPQGVVKAWMNSEGHRRNILNENYTHIGVGHVQNGLYTTQLFIRR